jgi:mRNA interferase RelE/StbE
MEVIVHKRAEKSLLKLNEPDFSRVVQGVKKLSEEPIVGDVTKLSGHENTYRLRVGQYRLLFHYNINENGDEYILVSKIDSRGQVYKGE